MTETVDTATETLTCQVCGITPVTRHDTHSGRLECRKCWNYRKMDRPAAQHWAKVAREFLSNVDGWDIMAFLPTAGVNLGENGMLQDARRVLDYSETLLRYGPPHMWHPPIKLAGLEPHRSVYTD